MARERTFNEAAHKLELLAGQAGAGATGASRGGRPRSTTSATSSRTRARMVLALGALGVVYGDIGTSPLYTEQVIFTQHADAAHATAAGVYGIVSLIFWALTIDRLGQVRGLPDAGPQPR